MVVDWRDALPREPNKRRPAVVVEDDILFAEEHPTLLVVPLTSDRGLAHAWLSVPIDPTPENGCKSRTYALSYMVTAASLRRIQSAPAHITQAQLSAVRAQIALSVGISTAP